MFDVETCGDCVDHNEILMMCHVENVDQSGINELRIRSFDFQIWKLSFDPVTSYDTFEVFTEEGFSRNPFLNVDCALAVQNHCIDMRFFAGITSCIIITLAIAVEKFFEDFQNPSHADLFLNEDQMPIDTLAMTDFSTPYSVGLESLNPSEPNDLASNVFSPEEVDSMLIADTPNECSTSIGSERRIRRGGETFCSSQDSDSARFDPYKPDWSEVFDIAMTDFDRQKCGAQWLSAYLVCSAPDLSDALTARLFALGTLEHCTRGIYSCAFAVHRR